MMAKRRMEMTSRQTPKPTKDDNAQAHAASHPALIALVRLVARSAAASDFDRAEAKRGAGHDEAD
jgi:hypothetical protein